MIKALTTLAMLLLMLAVMSVAVAGCGDDDDDDNDAADVDDDTDDNTDDDVDDDVDDDTDDNTDDDVDDDVDDDTADDDTSDDDSADDDVDDDDPHIYGWDFEDDATGSQPNVFQWFLYGDADAIEVTDDYPATSTLPSGNVVEMDKLRYDSYSAMKHLYVPLIQENFAISFDWYVTRANCGFRLYSSLMKWGFEDTLYSLEASDATDTFNVWTDYDPDGLGATPIDAGAAFEDWVNVRIEVNYDTLTTTTFFDNTPVVENASFFAGEYPYVGSFGWVIFSDVGSGPVYLDNIELYYMWE